MPELPEAETIKRELEEAVVGKKIAEVIVHTSKVIKAPAAKKFAQEVAGATIKEILRKGKAIVLNLSTNQDLVIQLGMTGQLIYPGSGKFARVRFLFSDGKSLDFNDSRMFGGLNLLEDCRRLAYIENLGPEPFDLKADEFKDMLAGKKTKVKLLLMDQQFMSGVGNIYANESLFRAGIFPGRPANSLSDKEKGRLFIAIKETLKEAIRYKGSSVDNYVQLSGRPGGYVPHLKVYGRDGQPCLQCGSVINKITLGGRGTYFCLQCQTKEVT